MTQLLWKISIYFVHLHAQVLCSYLFQIFSQLFTWHFAYLNLFLARQNSGTISTVVANAVTDVSYFLHIHFWFYCPIAYNKIFPRFDFFSQHWGGVDRGDVNCGGGHNDYGVFNCGAVIVAQSLWRRHHHDGCCVIAAASNAAAVTVTIAAQWKKAAVFLSRKMTRRARGYGIYQSRKNGPALGRPGGGGPPGSWDMWLKALFASSCYFFLYLQKSLCHRTSVVASLQQCLRHCASIIMVVVAKLWLVNIIWQIQHCWLTKSIRTVCAPIGQRVTVKIGRDFRR